MKVKIYWNQYKNRNKEKIRFVNSRQFRFERSPREQQESQLMIERNQFKKKLDKKLKYNKKINNFKEGLNK